MATTTAGPISPAAPRILELAADTLTPVAAALRLGDRLAFLLESVEGGARYGRHSFVGVRGRTLTIRGDVAELRDAGGELVAEAPTNDPLEALRAVLPPAARDPRLPFPLASGVGYLAYEAAARWEPIPLPHPDPLGLPEAVFHLPAAVIGFDHLEQVARIASLSAGDDALEEIAAALGQPSDAERPRPPAAQRRPPATTDTATYEAGVAELVEEIHAGEMLQAVLARRFSSRFTADPFDTYRALRRINPSPYLFYVDLGRAANGERATLIGASPELQVRVHGGQVVTRPIAGTRPRDEDPQRDAALEEELRADEKELAEHAMLVDLARNDVGRVAAPASVTVPILRSVERYSHVMHLVSEVHGRLRPDLDAFDALRATFPAGTVSGAPKIRAMASIARLEGERRGPYGGAVGFFSPDDLETAITIRSAVVVGQVAHVHAGAGIVADSQPAREAAEVDHKSRAIRAALATGSPGGTA